MTNNILRAVVAKSKMNRYFRIFAIAAFLGLLIFPNLTKADTFDYKVTDLTTGSTVTFAESSLASSGGVTSFLSTTGAPILEFVWNTFSNSTCLLGSPPNQACAGVGYANIVTTVAGFTPGSFLSPGTYQGFSFVQPPFSNTLTVTITEVSGVPEPSSLMLLVSGLLGVAGIKLRRTSC